MDKTNTDILMLICSYLDKHALYNLKNTLCHNINNIVSRYYYEQILYNSEICWYNLERFHQHITQYNIRRINLKSVSSVAQIKSLSEYNIVTVQFHYFFNTEIHPRDLPLSLRSLSFGRYFNQPIDQNVLPAQLKELIFSKDNKYTYCIEPNVLPSQLKTLKLGYYTHELKKDTIPISVTHLSIDRYSFVLYKNVLPPMLKYLSIGKQGRCLIDGVPESINELNFDGTFNRNVRVCACKYSQSISDNLLNIKLITVTMQNMINHNNVKLSFNNSQDFKQFMYRCKCSHESGHLLVENYN